MISENRLLTELKDAMIKAALVAVTDPANGDAFKYGVIVGKYRGLEEAVRIINDILSDDEEDDR